MRPLTRQDYRERILRVLVHIQEHLDDPLELESLARIAAFSPFHFHRLFRGLVGESVKEHIRRLRLERAAHFVKNTRRPIVDIALEASFEAHEAFTRAFRQAFGMSPSAYRAKRTRQRPVIRDGRVHYVEAGEAPAFSPVRDPLELEPRLCTRAPTPVVFIRNVGPYELVDASLFDRLIDWAKRRGLPPGPLMGIPHDDPTITPPERQRFDACLAAPADTEVSGDLGREVLPGGEFAVANHAGPLESVAETYLWLGGEWLPPHGRRMAKRPMVEIYRGHPFRTAPREMVTEVWLPLEPVSPTGGGRWTPDS